MCIRDSHNAQSGERLPADGIAARTFASAGGVNGDIISLDSPEETQGRGTPHGHSSVRTLGRRNRQLLDELQRLETEDPEELTRRIIAFQHALLRETTSKQFCSILEFQDTVASGAKTIHRGEELPTSPCTCMDTGCNCGGNCDRIVEPDVPGSWSSVFCTECRTFRTSGTSATATLQPTTSPCVCTESDCVCKGNCERFSEPEQSIGTSDSAMWFASTRCVPCRRYYITFHCNEDASISTEAANARPRIINSQSRPLETADTPTSALPEATTATSQTNIVHLEKYQVKAQEQTQTITAEESNIVNIVKDQSPSRAFAHWGSCTDGEGATSQLETASPGGAPEIAGATDDATAILEGTITTECVCIDSQCSCKGQCSGRCAPTISLGDSDLQHWFASTMCCLLYTSPSPRDGLLSRMPSSA